MENAADALKIAGAVLIFVLALSVIIFAFTQTRQVSDTILTYRDRESEYVGTVGTDLESSYYYGTKTDANNRNQTEREVGLETAIPTIYRAYLENYKIVFVGLSEPLYKIKHTLDSNLVDKYTIDLEGNVTKKYPNVRLGSDQEKAVFLKGILYHNYDGVTFDNGAIHYTGLNAFNRKFFVTIDNSCGSIYDQLKNANHITEYIGVYYQEDSQETDSSTTGDDVPENNKTEKRVITYKIE